MRLLIAVITFTLAACDADASHGSPPSIGNVQLMPTTIPVGITTMIRGEIEFSEPDADLDILDITLTTPAGERSQMDVDITSAAGKSEGLVAFVLSIAPPSAGDYRLELVLVDAEGNPSDPTFAELTAE